MFCGSILTSSDSGSWSRRPIEIAAAEGRVELGQLVAADLAGRVDAGAGLVDDDVGELGELGVGRVGLGAATGGGGGEDGCGFRDPRRDESDLPWPADLPWRGGRPPCAGRRGWSRSAGVRPRRTRLGGGRIRLRRSRRFAGCRLRLSSPALGR